MLSNGISKSILKSFCISIFFSFSLFSNISFILFIFSLGTSITISLLLSIISSPFIFFIKSFILFSNQNNSIHLPSILLSVKSITLQESILFSF
ncbi:MAG: hypothetical protein P1U46_03650 [Patescibacteria group bacterium]|nr:hypothetical protein [Patescibacteria group bacterium]